MLGFAIYSYEGIGVVMPIMQSAENPERFLQLLTLAIGTLTSLYVIFGSVCYSAYGSDTKPIITEMLPNNGFTATIKILFCINLILGYSICIHPTNMIIENWVFQRFKISWKRTWAKNFSRTLVCISATILALKFEGKIDKFIGLLGALLCAPLALTIPVSIHLKMLSVTKFERIIDSFLVICSIGVLIFSTW